MAARRLPHFEIVPKMTAASGRAMEGGWFFRVRALNGRILCHSEIYDYRRSAISACRAINPALEIKVIR